MFNYEIRITRYERRKELENENQLARVRSAGRLINKPVL